MEQIIPIQDAEEYTISMASKQQEEIQTQSKQHRVHKIRKEFWDKLLPLANQKSSLFSNISSSKDHWISAGSGIS
jgi:hypothetical protein